MTFGIAFYILMLIWLLYGGVSNWPSPNGQVNRLAVGGHLLLFLIILLLGWSEFGPPLRGK